MRRRILFLISDSGGGHRAGAEAIAAALAERPDAEALEYRIEDALVQCRFPLSALNTGYHLALKYGPFVYGALYHATNGERRYRTLVESCTSLYRHALMRLLRSYSPDVIVSVHPLLNHVALRARAEVGSRAPVLTVITDLGRVHAGWIAPAADAIVVPSAEVRSVAIERGVSPQKVHLLGHPVHPRFADYDESRQEIRHRLALPQERQVVLLMAGGEGGGKLSRIADAIGTAGLKNAHVVVCTGRNETLKERLDEARSAFDVPMTVLGFTSEVPALMRAADLLVTKAGPGAIAEACVAAVPMIVYDYVPGQERGNIDHVLRTGIGEVTLSVTQTVRAVQRLLRDPRRLERMRECERRIARPQASRQIADLVIGFAGIRQRQLAAAR
ncbi:MAG: UDP-N-acetylglucosamine 2-epimerase [bacterium]|nr:UDP-N-acetylglucosamine 2-epimerase [bacterium]